jgi:hypothetical protein
MFNRFPLVSTTAFFARSAPSTPSAEHFYTGVEFRQIPM